MLRPIHPAKGPCPDDFNKPVSGTAHFVSPDDFLKVGLA
jgi:hypothetical protein